MIVKSISNSSLNLLGKQKISFNSANINQSGVYDPTASNNNQEEEKVKLKKAYRKGVLSGILFSVVVVGGDLLCEYLIKRNATKVRLEV